MTVPLPQSKLDALVARLKTVESDLAAGPDRDTYVKLSREFSELQPLVEAIRSYQGVGTEIADLDAMLADAATDPEMRALAEAEKPALEAQPRGARAQDPPRADPEGRDGRAQRHPGNPRRHRRRRGRAVRRRPVPHVRALCRRATAGRSKSMSASEGEHGRLQGNHRRDQGTRRLRQAEIRVRRAPRAARARHRGVRAASTPRPRPSRCCPRPRTSTSRSTRATSGSTPCAPAAPAASTSTRPNPRSASPTCRPASW